MNITVLVINGLAIAGLIAAFLKDKERGLRSTKAAFVSFAQILPTIFIIVVIIGLLLGFFPEETIRQFIGDQSGVKGLLITAGGGSILHIPSIIAFPLAASFLDIGVSITFAAVFITTLTMIGVVTLPVEIRELGWRFALLRNGLSFVAALIIALIMGAIL